MPTPTAEDLAKSLSTKDLKALYLAKNTSTADLIKQHKEQARVPYTQGESALRGAAQGASLGFADEAVGLLKAVGKRVLSSDDESAGNLFQDYRKERSSERAKNQQAEQDNPGSYIMGNIGGGVATSVIPGLGFLNAAKGAGVASKVATAAKGGAAYAAGASSADLTRGEFGDFAKDIGTGAATGAVVQGAFSGIGKLGSSMGQAFQKVPEERAVKAVTGQNISALRKATGTTLRSPGDVAKFNKAVDRMGRDILDEPGVLGALDKVEDIAPKLAGSRDKYGKLIGEVGKQIDEQVPNAVNAKNIADRIIAFADDIPLTEAGKALQKRLYKEAKNFSKIKAMTFSEAQKFKNQFNYKAVDADSLISNQDAVNKVRNIISKEMEDTAEKLSSPQVSPKIKGYHGTYEKFSSDGIKPSKQGHFGEGYYLNSDKAATANYGSAIHEYDIDPKSIMDLSGAQLKPEALKFFKEVGFNVGQLKKPSKVASPISKVISEIREKFPGDETNGVGAMQKLQKLLKDKGFTGIKFSQNDSDGNIVIFGKEHLGIPGASVASQSEKGNGPLAELIKNYKLYKSKYGTFKNASDAATDRVQKNLTNRFVSPSDYGLGSAIGVTYGVSQEGWDPKALLYGAAGAGANKLMRERGSAFAARTAENLLKALKSDGVQGLIKAAKPVLEGVRKGNPAAMATFQLLRQSDPRAAEILNEQSAMQRKAGGN